MSWYGAHVVVVLRIKEPPPGGQLDYTVFENIIIVEAISAEEAFAKARSKAAAEYVGDYEGSLTEDGGPAVAELVGIRKVVLAEDDEEVPGDLTELSYSKLTIQGWDNVVRFARGQKVSVVCEPDDE